MPEPIRNRREQTVRETDHQDSSRLRPGFGPGEDPLAELARIVGDTAPVLPQTPTSAQQGAGVRRSAPDTRDAASGRDFPRRDTSWRDPQARTTVRAGLTAKPVSAQLADLEAELFSEIRSENIRTLPPAPDLAELGLPDARLPQYAGTTHDSAMSAQGRTPRAQFGNAARAEGSGTRLQGASRAGDEDLDDEVTLPMHAVLRPPAAARTSEDHRMQQPPRLNTAPVTQATHGANGAERDPYSDHAHYGDHTDYDPAGALGAGAYDEAEAAYYADARDSYPDAHPSDAHPAPGSAHGAQYANAVYPEDEGDYDPAYVAPRVERRPAKRSNPLMVGMVAVVGIAVLGIGGVFTYRAIAGNGATDAFAPLIHADTKPMKELVAQQPPVATGPSLDTARTDNQDRLVTQAEDPVDHVPGKPVRVVGTGTATPSLAPVQRVRSVIVKPDGTIVTPDDAQPKPLVQTASLPVPTMTDTPQPAAAAATAQPIIRPPATATATPPPAPVVRQETTPLAAKPAPLATPKPPVAEAAPLPIAKPGTKPALVPHAPAASEDNAPLALGPGGAPTARVASANPPAAVVQRAAPTDAGTAEYMVQISAQRSDAEARHALAAAQQKYAALGAKGGDVQQADLGARGTFYRVRLGGGSQQQAAALCAQIKAQGADCMVAKR